MSTNDIFRASAIQIGSCGSPTCKNVHFQLLDANGVVRAIALMNCDEVWPALVEMVDVATKLTLGDMIVSAEPGSTLQ